MTWLGRCSLQPAGISPPPATYFWLDPKVGKRSSPHCARPLAAPRGSLRCSELQGRPELAAFAALSPLRHAGRVRRVVCLSAHALGFLRCSAAQRGNPETRTAVRAAGCLAVGCSEFAVCAAEQRRRAARVPQARYPSGSRRLFEQSERSERSELLRGAGLRAAQGTRSRRRRASAVGRASLPPILHEQERRSPCGGRNPPRALTQCSKP